MTQIKITARPYQQIQKLLRKNPQKFWKDDYKTYYENSSPRNLISPKQTYDSSVLDNTVAIGGVAFGDEGKGRLVDNEITRALSQKNITKVFVVRMQGGNNAGHTVEHGGIKVALHVIPSIAFHLKAVGIMDKGIIIHPEDLVTEITYVEKNTKKSLRNRLFLSQDAILCTDLERAEEFLNAAKSGSSRGGTRRGIGPSYGHFIDRTGLTIRDLIQKDWKQIFETRYEQYEKLFKAFEKDVNGVSLANVEVPDFRAAKMHHIAKNRTVGTKKSFIQRLQSARREILQRKLVQNIHDIYRDIDTNHSVVIFELAQAAGLDAYNGTRPDVTSSVTTMDAITLGTGYWIPREIARKIGVAKATYTSSVGVRIMPTHVQIPKNVSDLPSNATDIQKWAAWIREEAHEYGTTTGRPRDIDILDLEMLRFNIRISGVNELQLTHLDLARKDSTIPICTHYTNKNNETIFYHPYLYNFPSLQPHVTFLPGWDGKACQKAKTFQELPENAQRFLAFVQSQLGGCPITAVTTGPQRDNFITLK